MDLFEKLGELLGRIIAAPIRLVVGLFLVLFLLAFLLDALQSATGAIVIFGVAGLIAFLYHIRRRQERHDAAQREAAREALVAREDERERAAVLGEIASYFPFLAGAVEEHLETEADAHDAIVAALGAIPSVTLGRTFYGLPAILPESERRKHLYVVGKTGSGKTSLLLHLMRSDLRAGHGLGVIAPEAELFRDSVLPLVPKGRVADVLYFAPGHPENRVTFNPLEIEEGDNRGRAAEELFSIFKRAVGEEDFGVRMSPILGNAFAALVGREGASLFDVKRLLEKPDYRAALAEEMSDPYLRDFWLKTYPSYPKGSHLPVVNRLDQFLRPIPVRRAVCAAHSTLSIRRALERGQILLIDLSGLSPDSCLLLGQMLLSKFQVELMRREALTEDERRSFYLYADEFQTFAGVAEGTWRELLSRGRRYGLGLTLAHQFPGQLPAPLQDEIFGNVASIVAFALGAKDAQTIRKEFLQPSADGGEAQPASLESLTGSKPGEAIARLGSGAYALPLAAPTPLEPPDPEWGLSVRAESWQRYGAKDLSSAPPPTGDASPQRVPETPAASPIEPSFASTPAAPPPPKTRRAL